MAAPGWNPAWLVVGLALVSAAPTVLGVPDNDRMDHPRAMGAVVPVLGTTSGLPAHGPFRFTETVNTAGATTDPGERLSCGTGSTIWYRWVVHTPGPAALDTEGSDFDTVLGVYSIDFPGVINLVDCNDDFFGAQSRVEFVTRQGTTYLIQVGGFFGAQGLARITLDSLAL